MLTRFRVGSLVLGVPLTSLFPPLGIAVFGSRPARYLCVLSFVVCHADCRLVCRVHTLLRGSDALRVARVSVQDTELLLTYAVSGRAPRAWGGEYLKCCQCGRNSKCHMAKHCLCRQMHWNCHNCLARGCSNRNIVLVCFLWQYP